jgi:hypothetical protein
MSNPTRIKLLEFVEIYGIGHNTNISPFFVEHFEKPKTTDPFQWRLEMEEYSLFLRDLNNRGFIIDFYSGDKIILNNLDNFKWFDEVDVNVYITSSGIDYLDQYHSTQAQLELNKSYKRVNEASLLNYSVQKWGIGLTILFTLATVVITGINYKLSEKNYQLSLKNSMADSISSINVGKRLDTLTHMISRLQQTILLPKNPKTYPPQKRPSH